MAEPPQLAAPHCQLVSGAVGLAPPHCPQRQWAAERAMRRRWWRSRGGRKRRCAVAPAGTSAPTASRAAAADGSAQDARSSRGGRAAPGGIAPHRLRVAGRRETSTALSTLFGFKHCPVTSQSLAVWPPRWGLVYGAPGGDAVSRRIPGMQDMWHPHAVCWQRSPIPDGTSSAAVGFGIGSAAPQAPPGSTAAGLPSPPPPSQRAALPWGRAALHAGLRQHSTGMITSGLGACEISRVVSQIKAPCADTPQR